MRLGRNQVAALALEQIGSPRGRSWRGVLRAVVVAVGIIAAAWAHNPDTSYARVEIGAQAVRFRFTYDLFTLHRCVAMDADHDGRTSRAELASALPAIHAFLRDHISVEIDDELAGFGTPTGFIWPPEAGDTIPASDYHTANGLVHFDFVQPVEDPPESVALSFHFGPPLAERHTVLGSFDRDGEKHEVTFTRLEPDYEFVTGHETQLARRLWKFLRLGVTHIFAGYDHLCFLLALVLVSTWRELVKIVTSFTVAHSLTLIAAALGWIQLPARLVEPAIAATIIYVAVQNVRGAQTVHRWRLTFAFGLIHGFGFASVLGALSLPTTGLVRCLLAFNVGVELGQLAFVASLLPLVAWLRRSRHAGRFTTAISLLLAAFGTAWFIERAWDLQLMPF